MKVNISKLKFKTIIGILEYERNNPQEVIVDCSFEYNFKNKFIDYSQVTKFIKKTIKKKQFFLIEDAIIYLDKKLNKKYKIKNLKIKITKPNILKNCIVSVENK